MAQLAGFSTVASFPPGRRTRVVYFLRISTTIVVDATASAVPTTNFVEVVRRRCSLRPKEKQRRPGKSSRKMFERLAPWNGYCQDPRRFVEQITFQHSSFLLSDLTLAPESRPRLSPRLAR